MGERKLTIFHLRGLKNNNNKKRFCVRDKSPHYLKSLATFRSIRSTNFASVFSCSVVFLFYFGEEKKHLSYEKNVNVKKMFKS